MDADAFGAADGPHKLPGWTRICHSELSSGGSPLNWDWSQAEVHALAHRAKRVRIQTKNRPLEAVVSRPNAYPIEDLRKGNPIGFGRQLDATEVGLFWESSSAVLLLRLLHVGDCWRDHGHKEEVGKLETNIYWAACNGKGLHWHGLVHGGHLPPTCTWDNSTDSDLELYVDAEVDSEALLRDATIDILVRDISGSEVASLKVPAHETVGALKKRICGPDESVYTKQLLHGSSLSTLSDGTHLRGFPQPVELQLVRLPLDRTLGVELLNPAYNGDVREVERMLRNCADPNEKTPEGMTPLMLAAQSGQPGHVQVVRLLCAAGANKDDTAGNGATAFCLGAATGHLEAVRFLAQAGASRSAAFDNGAGPLHVAAHGGHREVVEFLCEVGEEVDSVMSDGSTPLLRASQAGHLSVVAYLCNAGADKDHEDRLGWTPLLLATHGGQLEVVRFLCAAGADKEKAFRDGSTPLMMAAATNQLEVLEYLCRDGANKDAQRWDGATSLHMGAMFGNSDAVRYLCDVGADVEVALPNGMTPIFVASASGHLEVLKALHEAGAITNKAMEGGATPLLLVAAAGHIQMVRWLLAAGAIVDTPQLDGRTPLLVAAEFGHLETVRELCHAGANKDRVDLNGWTPLLRAIHGHRHDVVAWLREAGATEAQGMSRYHVDNTELQQASPGVAYRSKPDLEERAGDKSFAAWGATVIGTEDADGWLRVGDRYLPFVLDGKRILVAASDGD